MSIDRIDRNLIDYLHSIVLNSIRENSLPLRFAMLNKLLIYMFSVCNQFRIMFIRWIAISIQIIILALSSTAVLANQCPDGSITVDNFPAYKSDLTSNQLLAINDISKFILKKGFRKWYVDGHGAVFGSRAKLGSTETHAIALDRANVVVDVLKFAMDDYIAGSSSKFKFVPRSFGNIFPVTTNKTRTGRAKNRRVVLCPFAAPPIIDAPKIEDPDLTLDDGLSELQKDPKVNAITTCLIKRLKDKTKDHSYLPYSQIELWYNTEVSKLEASSPQFFELDLRKKLNRRLSRIKSVSTSESPQVRFNNAFEDEQIELIKGISIVNNIDCYDPQKRRAKGRLYFRKNSADKNSFYSCREIKRHVDVAIPPGDSVHRCEGS